MRRLFLLTALATAVGCQSLPPRSEMLETACAHQPCRTESLVTLYDAAGTAHDIRFPAGPILAGGVLSIVQDETQHVAVSVDEEGRARLRWLAPGEHEDSSISFRLQQIETAEGHASRLAIRNRLEWDVWIDAEQFPVKEDRFYPLALPPVPAGKQVSQQWPHTILEIQITGLRPLSRDNHGDP